MGSICSFVLAALALAVGQARADESWLAIEWSVHGDLVEHDGDLFACISLTLRPEEHGSTVLGVVEVQPNLPESPEFDNAGCLSAGGSYTRVDRLRSFINSATEIEAGGDCDAGEDIAEIASVANTGGGDGTAANQTSPLGVAIQAWNDRFFNMDTVATRQNSVRFHGRGSEAKHLAQEVSHFVMPKSVQGRIEERLNSNRKMLFDDDGVGQGGTTGAHFISGNVGFGNADEGASIMDTLFPPAVDRHGEGSGADTEGDDANESTVALFDGDGYARKRGGNLFADASTADGQELPPDLKAYEDEIKTILMHRSDVHYSLGDHVSFQFQHRLWRYGPNFDPKAKGGIWHKDTCPFGINGALPPGSLMFTIVYILYTENLNGPTAGTRVKDDDGTVFSLPCIAGEGNIIRSGESDSNAFFHSGPLNIQKLDQGRPAYRLMLQSKAVLKPNEWDSTFRVIPTKGNWRGLRITPVPPANDTESQLTALRTWAQRTSTILTRGVGESNAVGFEAYPINVHRAWEVTRDLCKFVGIKTAGFLPETDSALTPVVIFGFDVRYSEGLVSTLLDKGFRVLVVASDAEFAEMRADRQDTYANMETADIADVTKVTATLRNSAFDFHVIVDVPPIGTRALGSEGLMDRYGPCLRELASKSAGEGRLSSVTLLSQQMPFHGRDTAGKVPATDSTSSPPALSATQEAFLAEEKSWVDLGDQKGVRVVIMRVADRVVAHHDSALHMQYSCVAPPCVTESANPCRVEMACDENTPVSRIHAEDLAAVLLRMLSMFDIVETHGADSSMRGTASMGRSLQRFPTGTTLDVVDDGEPDSMVQAEAWAALMMGKADACAVCSAGVDSTSPWASHGSSPGSNRDLKNALGMPQWIYPTYRHGGAKLFGSGEI